MLQLKFNRLLHPNEHSQRIFWYLAKELSWEPTKVGHIFTKRNWWTWIQLKMLLPKFVLLVWYSNTKIIFRIIELVFGLRNRLWKLKMPNFYCPQSSCLTRYQKILWGSSFGCKNLWSFIYHNMKFHNCHHTALLKGYQ